MNRSPTGIVPSADPPSAPNGIVESGMHELLEEPVEEAVSDPFFLVTRYI